MGVLAKRRFAWGKPIVQVSPLAWHGEWRAGMRKPARRSSRDRNQEAGRARRDRAAVCASRRGSSAALRRPLLCFQGRGRRTSRHKYGTGLKVEGPATMQAHDLFAAGEGLDIRVSRWIPVRSSNLPTRPVIWKTATLTTKVAVMPWSAWVGDALVRHRQRPACVHVFQEIGRGHRLRQLRVDETPDPPPTPRGFC